MGSAGKQKREGKEAEQVYNFRLGSRISLILRGAMENNSYLTHEGKELGFTHSCPGMGLT